MDSMMYKRKCSWMYYIKEIGGKKVRIVEWHQIKDRETGAMCILFRTVHDDWYMYRESVEDIAPPLGVKCPTLRRHCFFQSRSGYTITINNPSVTDSIYWTYTDLIDRIELI